MLYKMTNFHLYRTEISRQLIYFTRLREADHTHSQSLRQTKMGRNKNKMGANGCTDIFLATTAIPVGHIRTKSLLNKTAVMRFRSPPPPKASAPHPGHPGIYSLGVLGVIHNPHHFIFILMGTSFTYFQVNFFFFKVPKSQDLSPLPVFFLVVNIVSSPLSFTWQRDFWL